MTGATDTLREVTKKNALVDQLVQVSLVYLFFFQRRLRLVVFFNWTLFYLLCVDFDLCQQQCQKEHSDGRVQLRDILSVPMQRILKYHLLLDKLVHETSPVGWMKSNLNFASTSLVGFRSGNSGVNLNYE